MRSVWIALALLAAVLALAGGVFVWGTVAQPTAAGDAIIWGT
jgi:hypothetical protein